jgi:hypothetical protein
VDRDVPWRVAVPCGVGDCLLDVGAPAIEQLSLVVAEVRQSARQVDERDRTLIVAVKGERHLAGSHGCSSCCYTQRAKASSLIVPAATFTIVSTVSSAGDLPHAHAGLA